MKLIPEMTESRILAAARVMTGSILLAMVAPLMDRSFIDALPGQLNSFATNNPYPFFKMVVYGLLMPQAQVIGAAFAIGQLMMGLSFVIGFLSRTFSLLGMLFCGLMFLATQHVGWVYQQYFVLMGLVFLFFAALDIGRYYGLDGFLFAPHAHSAPSKKRSYTKNKSSKKVRPLLPSVKERERDYDYDDADDYEEAYA